VAERVDAAGVVLAGGRSSRMGTRRHAWSAAGGGAGGGAAGGGRHPRPAM